MLKVGITGGIGSGKSIVCMIYSKLGIPVFNADNEAKDIINTNSLVKDKLISIFGKEIYDSKGIIDRQKLSSIIFNDKEKIKIVNSIVHPVVIDNYNKWLDINKKYKYTIKEAAILFESGANSAMDYIITVYSPSDLKIKRVMQRDKCDESIVITKINNQLDDEIKIMKSDFVIYNDDKQLVIPQVLKIHNKLLTA